MDRWQPGPSCATLEAMARSATIYRASLELSHVDRDVYGDHTLTIARHPSETLERMVMRILAYGLRCADGLEFGRGVSATDEPDLWRREGDGRVVEWIEVGQPDAKRLVKASRKSQACRLFVFGEGATRWRDAHLADPKLPETWGSLGSTMPSSKSWPERSTDRFGGR